MLHMYYVGVVFKYYLLLFVCAQKDVKKNVRVGGGTVINAKVKNILDCLTS